MELLVLLVFVIIYFIPTFNAFSSSHPSRNSIAFINIFFGLTIVGWFVALLWSWNRGSAGVGDDGSRLTPPTSASLEPPLNLAFLRAKVETLREKLGQAQKEFGRRFDQIDAEIAFLEHEIGKEAQTAAAEAQQPFSAALKRATLTSEVISPWAASAGGMAEHEVVETGMRRGLEEEPELELIAPQPPSAPGDVSAKEAATRQISEETLIEPPALAPALENITAIPDAFPAPEQPVEAQGESEVVSQLPLLEQGSETGLEAPVSEIGLEASAGSLSSRKTAPATPAAKIDWETLIGGSWLNIIGIIILTVGVALLTEHTLHQFGPLGKIATGIAVSFVLLLTGLFLERKEDRYKIFARTLIGGGWAVLYFIAFAAYNVEAARIVDDPVIALFVMMGVATAMILHSLTFRSQLVTGLAYGLGYFAVGLTPVTMYSLIACAILAVSQIILLRLFDWQTLALVAVVGVYLNHWRWLERLMSESAADSVPLAPDQTNYWLSIAILAFYWVLIVYASLARSPRDERERTTQITVSVANTVGMLGVSTLQILTFGAQDLYLLTGGAAAAYAIAAFASRRAEQLNVYAFNTVIGGVLYALSLPLALEPRAIPSSWLSVYWLVGGLAALAIAFRIRDLLLRVVAYILCAAACYAVLAIVLVNIPANWRALTWFISPAVAMALFVMSDILEHAASRGGISRIEVNLAPLWGYSAAFILAVFLQKALSTDFVGLSIGFAGLALFEFGRDFARLHSRIQGYLLLFVGALEMVFVNLAGGGAASLWVGVAPSIPMLYYVSWRMRGFKRRADFPDWLGGQIASCAATLIYALFVWREMDPSLVVLAWLPFAVLLFELGALSRTEALRLQAYILSAVSIWALLLFDLGDNPPEIWAPRWMIAAFAAAYYYYLFYRLGAADERSWRTQAEYALSDLPSFVGSAILAILAWREIDHTVIALIWLVFSCLLLEVGARKPRAALRLQAYVLSAIAFAELLTIGFSEPAATSIDQLSLALLLSAILYYYLFIKLSAPGVAPWRTEGEYSLSDIYGFAGSALLLLMSWRLADHGFVGLIWLSFAVTLFETGAIAQRPALRLQSYLVACAALVAVAYFDISDSTVSTGVTAISGVRRVLAVGAAAFLYYYLSGRMIANGARRWATEIEISLSDAPSFAGSGLLAALIWYNANPGLVGLEWLCLAVPLYETGGWRNRTGFRLQAYLLFISALGALLAVNLYQIYSTDDSLPIAGPRSLIVSAAAAIYYYLFWRLRVPNEIGVGSPMRFHLRDTPSAAGTLLLAILIWKENGVASVALGWAFMALTLYEVGRVRPLTQIVAQAHVMSALTFGRLFIANFVLTSEGLIGISHRLLTIMPIVALFYYLRAQTKADALYANLYPRWLQPEMLARLYSWSAALLLAALCRFELGRADWIMGLSPLLVGLLVAGHVSDDRHFRYQAYVLSVLATARTFATNVFLTGSFYGFGVSERFATILSLLFGLVAATAVSLFFPKVERRPGKKTRIMRALDFFDTRADDIFGFLTAILAVVLIYCETPEGWVTSTWALVALTLIVVGFSVSKRSFRYCGLMLLFVCVLKLVAMDLRGVEPIYRILSYIVLGIILLLASFVYARRRDVLKKYM